MKNALCRKFKFEFLAVDQIFNIPKLELVVYEVTSACAHVNVYQTYVCFTEEYDEKNVNIFEILI